MGAATLNLIRRCADGSLRMSADRWRLAEVNSEGVRFRTVAHDQAEDEQVLVLGAAEVRRVTWDRLPKQRTRSQLRFHLCNGDLWTFSGRLEEPAP